MMRSSRFLSLFRSRFRRRGGLAFALLDHACPMLWAQRCPSNVIERDSARKRWQVVRSCLRERFKTRSQLDESWLAERRSEKADAHGRAEYHGRRHLHDGIALGRRKARCSKNEMVAEDKVGGPCRIVRGANHRIKMELADGSVDAVHSVIVISGKRLVVSHAAKSGLRIVRTGRHGCNQVPDVLVEIRHLDIRMCIVKCNGSIQCLACHWHSH